MNYEQRLIAAAKYVYAGDSCAGKGTSFNPADFGITATLKPHQIEGVYWLIKRYRLGVNVILGDEMGLGKTLQAISFLSYLKVCQKSLGPFLVLCPLSIVDGWVSEVTNFGTKLRVLSYVGEKEHRCNMRLKMYEHVKDPSLSFDVSSLPFDLLLTTYDIALIDQDFLSQFPWQLAVIDEAQRLKNPSSVRVNHFCLLHPFLLGSFSPKSLPPLKDNPLDASRTQSKILNYVHACWVCLSITAKIILYYAINVDVAKLLQILYNVLKEKFVIPRKLLMTGTPIQNNLTELWALMHFCVPLVFGTLEQFLSTFKDTGDTSCRDAEKSQKQFRILKYILGAFMLRRTKSKLIESGHLMLPPLTEITVMAPLVFLQKKVYLSILRKELPKLIAFASGASNTQSLQNIVIQLRKACSHPYLFPGIEPEPFEEGEHLVQASGKLVILDKLLQKLQGSGHRVLLFAQMTHTLDILQDFLELRKYSYERLDGSIRAEERFAAIRSFSKQSCVGDLSANTKNSCAFVFLISTRAGGVGLNLVAADTVVFYEQDWNPQVDKQALQRAHRIGQKSHVLSINLVTSQTVEEVIMRRAERKLQLSHNVIGDGIDQEGKEMVGPEGGDLRSVILGLHMFDPAEMVGEKSDQVNVSALTEMVEKMVTFRDKIRPGKDDRKFEINPMDMLNGQCSAKFRDPESITYDPGLDEASYHSWMEKFKEASPLNHDIELGMQSVRGLPDVKQLKADAARKKLVEKKLAKWETLGYHSLSVSYPVIPTESDVFSGAGAVHFVYGDCTHPSRDSPLDPAIIFSCIDESGNWGRGGMFDALAKHSANITDAYERAHEFGDLHLGDLHLVPVKEDCDDGRNGSHVSQWVALAVVQSYNPRRKVPRGDISIDHLEECLAKASYSATQNSASIHMPRIGYQDGSNRSEWYTVERLLRKYAALYGIQIFVYYYRRSD